MRSFENIAALSTAPLASGVGVIRISGESPLSIAEKMFKCKTPVKDFEPYKMYVGTIEGEGLSDFGMCVYFKSPKSYTGEDMVEFHCHGGVAITRAILNRIFSLGARSAERGEFTKRAFLNGKLSLSSCEGLIDMINAESTALAKSGLYLYRENLLKKIKNAQDELKNVLAKISANIDYPEEGIEQSETEEIRERIFAVKEKLEAIENTYKSGSKIKSGVKVVIVGKPNAGKSSVLNALLNEDKAIVTSVAGTTRDVVEGTIDISGVKFDFFDTAGIRETEDPVEKIGVSRSLSALNAADLVLFIIDSNTGITEEDEQIIKSLPKSVPVITVANKEDLSDFDGADISVSALNGEGIQNLKKLIFDNAGLDELALSGDALTEERHYQAIKKSIGYLSGVLDVLGVLPLDILTVDIEKAWSALGEISGETCVEEVISEIFSKFCVGK